MSTGVLLLGFVAALLVAARRCLRGPRRPPIPAEDDETNARRRSGS